MPGGADTQVLKQLIRETLAEMSVDTRPYSYNTKTAMAATGLAKWKLMELIRDDRLAVRQEGKKLIIDGDSLRRYIDSLPPRGLA